MGGQLGLPRALEAWQALSSDPYGAPPHSAGLSWHSSALFRPSPKIMSGASHVYFPPKGKVSVLKAHFYGHKWISREILHRLVSPFARIGHVQPAGGSKVSGLLVSDQKF